MMMNSILLETVSQTVNPSWDLLFTGAFVVLLVGVALYASAIPQGARRWWGLAALLGLLVIGGQVVGAGTARMLLLDAAAFVAVAMVWTEDNPQAKAAARSYLALLVVSVICLDVGLTLAENASAAPAFPLDKLIVALVVIGFGLKLALVPFYFWLPGLAEYARPMTTALIVSVVDIAAFGELAHLRAAAPWVFTDYAALWLTLALLSMFGGALLALAQRNLKRMLAYSTIDDMGYLLLGVLVGSTVGMSGALLAALSHAFFKVLLFGAVGVAEYQSGQPLTLDSRGMASRYPVSAAVFIAGALGMIGVPPLFGFIGRWRLYLAGVEYGGAALALTMAAATGLALLYYVRAIHRVWLGHGNETLPAAAPDSAAPNTAAQPAEPRMAVVVMIALLVLMLAVGLFPGGLTGWLG